MLRLLLIFASWTILIGQSAIPPKNNGALMARYIVHQSDYLTISSISTLEKIKGYPFAHITSISDGPLENGTGNVYMYMPAIGNTAKNVAADNRVSVVLGLIQGDYCKINKLDPEDPNCALTTMSGRLVKVPKGTDEYKFAKATLFERHPVMATWPEVVVLMHGFFVSKVEFEQILVLDQFGGALNVTAKEYFDVKPEELLKYTKENKR